ncbi:MAG: cytochrome o ubiquinol oxidase subunit IV [bacterium]|nr:cytochrome o ubiquinol oxidase subunit IV [bacterium]
MNTEHHTNHSKEHGSIRSYVIGFILSLIFTFIPYHLVVNKGLSGSELLAAILGIAVVQMAIQLIFFLHLGRGPKPLYNVVFFFATAGVIIVTIGASLFIMDNLYKNMSPQEYTTRLAQDENIAQIDGRDTGACDENKTNHSVVIRDDDVRPGLLEAKRCDTLTFINEDPKVREIAFGTHPDDVSYGGKYEIVLDDARPETVTLNEVGEFTFHDHRDSQIVGQFTVSE